jgi:hypothetical protein
LTALPADAEFIARSRSDLPAVTAYALQLEAEVERLRDEKRGLVLRAPDEPGEVVFQVEAVPFWPGANGEDWHTGTLDAASVAKVLRTIADRCERYWNAEAVERPSTEVSGHVG